MVTFGEDFGFKIAELSFQFIENVTKILTDYDPNRFEFVMSTPGRYLNDTVVEAYERNLSFSVFTDDFFPLVTKGD